MYKTAQKKIDCNRHLPTAEPSVSIHFNRGLSNEGKKEMPFSVRGTFRKRKACGLTSSVPIDVWHSLRHSSRSLVARHKLAARGRGGGHEHKKCKTQSQFIWIRWTLLTTSSAVTHQIGIFITICFQSRHHHSA